MFRQALKVLLPVVIVLTLTLGALAWSASSVAYAASRPAQSQTTPTPTPAAVYNSGYASPLYNDFIESKTERLENLPSFRENRESGRDRR